MRGENLKRHFMKTYPRCSEKKINELVSAILSNKYWKVHSSKDDAYYAIALTRARIPYMDGFMVRSTAPGIVIVSPRAARFCRRGRILVVKRKNDIFISETIMDWPAFLKMIKMDENLIYKHLVEKSNPPAFLKRRNFITLFSSTEK